MNDRDKVIVRTSVIGILANIILVGFKATIGLLSNSIAIVLDAVNNLSDALASLITIIGTKLASKKPDKKHPFGYGRIEYLSAMVVAALVLYAGITAGVESVQGIIDPQTPEYTTTGLIIISSAVIVKCVLGIYVKKKGREVNSGSLIASGSDALFDAILSLSVLASAVIFILWGISLEAYVGVIISIVIIKAGVEMLMETLDEILGKRVDRETLKAIRTTICEEPQVQGAYDLILHSYGPDRYVASAHVEIPDTMTVCEIDEMERRIADRVFEKHGIIMAAVGIYSVATSDESMIAFRSRVTHQIMQHDGVIQMHGFHVDEKQKQVFLDIILDYELKNRNELFKEICKELEAMEPSYTWRITPDIDV